MNLSFGARTLALIGVYCVARGCKPSHTQAPPKLVSGCPCDAPLSQTQLRHLTETAEKGNFAAERKLWDYFVWRGEDDKAAPWEDRLVRAGYPDAIGHRSDMLFIEAYHLRDTDPRKLLLLKQSIDLEARYRKAKAGTVMNVMVNGKFEQIRFSGEPDEGTRNMQKLLSRVQAAQGKYP